MFHKNDLRVSFIDDDKDQDLLPDFIVSEDDDDITDKNPVSSIVADIQKQRLKKNAALPKNTIADPAGVIVYQYIKLAGVKGDPIKHTVNLLLNKKKFEPKSLSDLTPIVGHNKIEAFALLYNAQFDYAKRSIKNDTNRARKVRILEAVFKEIAFKTLRLIPEVKISSMNKEFHAMMCNTDVNPYKAHEVIDKRFRILSQQLQHQIDDSYTFENVSACLIHNIMNPCRDSKCGYIHGCSLCGDQDHIATDPRCPKSYTLKDWFVKRVGEINRYYNNKSKRSRSFNNNNRMNRGYGFSAKQRNYYPPNQSHQNQNDSGAINTKE